MSDTACKDRIKDNMAQKEEYLKDLTQRQQLAYEDDDFETEESCQSERDEFPLDIEELKTIKILLSTGGPADYLIATGKRDEITPATVEYHFADWYDHAQCEVEKGSELWNYASEIWELYLDS